MAYKISTATGVADLMAQLGTFVAAHGWSQQAYSTASGHGQLFIYDGGQCYASFRWDTAAPQYLGVYQALGYAGGTDPGAQTGDSGNGAVSGTDATIGGGRSAKLVNSSMPYWFFVGTGSGTTRYVHVVAQTAVDTVVHFGVGNLSRFPVDPSWGGGEYAYGQKYTGTDQHGSAVKATSSYLLDGLYAETNSPFAATVHMESILHQGASKWGTIGNPTSPGNDRASNARNVCFGGFRGGLIARSFGRWGAGTQAALVPMYPVPVVAKTNDGATDNVYLLGTMPDVRGVNVQFYEIGNLITVGADNWYIFPTQKKSGNNVTGSTYWSGIAYRQNAA